MENLSSVPTILLIEHDSRRQQLVRRVLSDEGYQVLVAQKWQVGITLAQEARPNLILVDLDLPGIGGNALATRLRALPELKETPIVALADDGTSAPHTLDGNDQKRVLAAGCVGVISKPINPLQLAIEVDHYLQGNVQQKEEPKEQQDALVQELIARLEEQTLKLEESNRRLEESNNIRDNFLITVSRELRTPLTLITGYITLLQSAIPQLDLDEPPLSLIEMIEGLAQGTKRLNNIVQELVRVSRVVTGDVNLAIGPARISTLISATLSELDIQQRSIIQQHNLNRLPIIQADGNQIRLALRNVLNHLLNTIPETGRIFIGGQYQQDIVIISFRGTGVRITPAEQEMLFDRLYPAKRGPANGDGSGQRPEGSIGFGLAVANGIVQAHGGRIWAESAKEGEQAESTFYLLLPTCAAGRPVIPTAGSRGIPV